MLLEMSGEITPVSPAAGQLSFDPRVTSKTVQVTESTAAQIPATFLYYKSGTANGTSRTYRFEVTDAGGFLLASKDRSISYSSAKSVSSAAYATNTLTVISSTATNVTEKGFTQAYHPVPLASYVSSTVPHDYLSASGARLSVLVDLQMAEIDDGYQYIQILADQTNGCDSANSASGGEPGTPSLSCYMAGFEHNHGTKDTDFAKYTFPVVFSNNNSGATLPWKNQGNNVGNLCMQRFKSNCRAADGRLSVPASLTTLGIRFDASGSDDDDWQVKFVKAHIQAVPSGPYIPEKYKPLVSEQPVCKGSTVSVSLLFNEIVYAIGAPVLKTTWGDLSYVAGSGMNVLTFSGPVTADARTPLRISGLTGTVKGLTDVSFSWSGYLDVNRTVDDAVAPPLHPKQC